MLGGWLAANHTPLQMIVQASRRPRFFLPLISLSQPAMLVGSSCPNIRLGDAGRALGIRANAERAADDDLEGGLAGRTGRASACRTLCQDLGLISRLMGIMLDQIASEIDVRIARHPNLSVGQARVMLAQLQGLPELAEPARGDRSGSAI